MLSSSKFRQDSFLIDRERLGDYRRFQDRERVAYWLVLHILACLQLGS
jgi:hypothetical protein